MVTGFTDFVKAFSQFGNDMVKLAHVSGDRQNVSPIIVGVSCTSKMSNVSIPTTGFEEWQS